jgi:T4-like virus tail tube protein gp19
MVYDPKRSNVAGRFVMALDGEHCGGIKKFSGLQWESDLATMDHGPLNWQTKYATNYKVTDATLTMAFVQQGALSKWMQNSFDMNYVQKTGSISAGDFDFKETHRIDFMGALMKSVKFGALKGDSKDAMNIDVTFEVEQVKHFKGSGADIRGTWNDDQKGMTQSNFKFELSGLEDACKRIYSVDAIEWKQAVVTDFVGENRIPSKHPANCKVGDFAVTYSAADQGPWDEWATKWFQDGLSTQQYHKHGMITYLAPDMKTVLGTLELESVGIKKYGHEDFEANAEKIKRGKIELYCEKVKFTV